MPLTQYCDQGTLSAPVDFAGDGHLQLACDGTGPVRDQPDWLRRVPDENLRHRRTVQVVPTGLPLTSPTRSTRPARVSRDSEITAHRAVLADGPVAPRDGVGSAPPPGRSGRWPPSSPTGPGTVIVTVREARIPPRGSRATARVMAGAVSLVRSPATACTATLHKWSFPCLQAADLGPLADSLGASATQIRDPIRRCLRASRASAVNIRPPQ